MNFRFTALLALTLLVFTACKDDENIEGSGPVSIHFEHKFGPYAFRADGTTDYVNAAGETLRFDVFKYYVSNIQFTKDDGTVYAPAESYHLLNAAAIDDEGYVVLNLDSIPAGDYKSITMTLGVDSVRNSSGAQVGALDPVNGMFWTWNSGYIFTKMEGHTPDADSLMPFVYHIGVTKNARTITLALNDSRVTVRENLRPELHMIVDVSKHFSVPSTFSVKGNNFYMGGGDAMAGDMMDRFKGAFAFDHVHND